MREACGLFGVYGRDVDVAKLTYYGLYALQHRGQESAGIAVSDRKNIHLYKNMGLVSQVFNENILETLQGSLAIGHVRYSTTGSSVIANAQPFLTESKKHGTISVAHNGNLINIESLLQTLKANGHEFTSTSDTAVIATLISLAQAEGLEEAIIQSLSKLQGAFSLLFLTKDKLIGLRDPWGIRPLCLGKIDHLYVLSSETCGLDIIGAKLIREIAPGEMVIIDEDGVRSYLWAEHTQSRLCVFEFIYFARPDSILLGKNLYAARFRMGEHLAEEHPAEADLVIGVPDSGTPAAIGFATKAKIPFSEALIKNRYVGRTFIQPSQEIRDLGVKLKLNPIAEVFEGKRVVIIDDSIVRGTTSRKIVEIIRSVGAKEVHMRVSSPAIFNPCFYGIDTASKSELIAANFSIENIRKYLNADSLGYLSLEGMLKAIGLNGKDLCLACLNGEYPIKVPEKMERLKLIFR